MSKSAPRPIKWRIDHKLPRETLVQMLIEAYARGYADTMLEPKARECAEAIIKKHLSD